jgi:hypothetical protein
LGEPGGLLLYLDPGEGPDPGPGHKVHEDTVVQVDDGEGQGYAGLQGRNLFEMLPISRKFGREIKKENARIELEERLIFT